MLNYIKIPIISNFKIFRSTALFVLKSFSKTFAICVASATTFIYEKLVDHDRGILAVKGLARRTWGNKFVRVSWLIPKFRIPVSGCVNAQWINSSGTLATPPAWYRQQFRQRFSMPGETSLFMADARYARVDSVVVSMRTINGPRPRIMLPVLSSIISYFISPPSRMPASSFILRRSEREFVWQEICSSLCGE